MSGINLNECKLITAEEYCNLVDPEFVGQTRVDENDMYYMVWKSGGELYKTHNCLFSYERKEKRVQTN